jgi:ferredoxin
MDIRQRVRGLVAGGRTDLTPPERFPRATSRHDERDTMFARMAHEPGTAAYADYYARHPELKQSDDRLRSQPALLEPGGRYYDDDIAREADAYFEAIGQVETDEAEVRRWRERLETSEDPATTVKDLLRSYGAVAAGCAALDPEFVYTHKGRLDEDYGHEVGLDHPTVVVFLVEMDYETCQRAPTGPMIGESARQYYRAARASFMLEAVLRACGHEAKAHYDAHYDVILPPLAVKAGLGELGRNNLLIADRYGSRVRIGAVSTDLPLEHDAPVSLGAAAFCEICKKCADNCPSRALSLSGRESVAGVMKWPTRVEACYAVWRSYGTDCGICLAVCPFSHRNNWFHNLVRSMIRRFRWTHRPALWLDDLIYGRKWKPKGARDG